MLAVRCNQNATWCNAVRLAAIDVGSNSILLLVADVVAGVISSPVREEVRITRLGERLASDRALPSDAIERTPTPMDALGRTELIVSRRGLRHGVIIAASRTAL